MKRTLLSTVVCSTLAFASVGQLRQTGVQEHSLGHMSPVELSQQQLQSAPTPFVAPDEYVMKAICIDTLLYEDFQSETIPATWLNLDEDGNTDANGRAMDWYVPFDAQTTTPGDTNYVAASSSWFSPAGTANNVLILDAVAPCANTILQWKSAPFEGPTYMDGYEVRVSTTGTNVADFTTTVFMAAESLNGTATPTAGNVHSSYNGNNGVLQEWSVDLGAFDDQTIYVAFFHNSNDDNMIMIDDIFMGTFVPYDLVMESAVKNDRYYSTPLSQVVPLMFSSDVSLSQNLDVTNPTVEFEVFQNVTSVFTDAPSLGTMAPGTMETFNSGSYTPVAVDTFKVTFNASADEVDPDLTNNSDSLFFVVSDSVMSTVDGNFNGALGIGAGISGFLGNQYTLAVDDELTSITFTLSTPTIGDTVIGVVYDTLAGVPNQIVAMTDTLFVTDANAAEYTLMLANGPLTMVAGDYIVGVQESISANVSIATNTEYYTPEKAKVFFNGAWGNAEDYGFPITFLVSANFGITCDEITADYSESIDELNVDFTDASTNVDAWSWDFGDGNTSTLQNPTHTYAVDGTYNVCLTASSDCDDDVVCTSVTVEDCVDPTASFTNVSTELDVDFTNASTSGTTTFAWDFDDGNSSTDENPSHSFATDGTYNVCLTITDECGTDSFCEDVIVSTIGINENNLVNGLSLYPMPAKNIMTIENLTSGENFKLELLNSLGQVVKVVQTRGLSTIQFNMSEVISGYYNLRVSNSTVIGTRPVVVKH